MARQIFLLLVAILLGYIVGFNDAKVNERMFFMRVVERVQNFGERTVGDPARQREEAAERASDRDRRRR